LEVVPPERADLVLSSYIPNGERNVLVFYGLDIETDCGDGGDDFTELEFVEDGGFASGIKADLY
jgi:hypothetical protein